MHVFCLKLGNNVNNAPYSYSYAVIHTLQIVIKPVTVCNLYESMHAIVTPFSCQ